MGDSSELTRAMIFQIAWEVREGKAKPDEARRLLEYFCDCYDEGKEIPEYLIRHLRDAFRAYLNTRTTTIQRALGLTRKRGRPEAGEEQRTHMAAEVLRHRLKGEAHQDALESASEVFGCGISIVGEAWAQYKQDAIAMLRLERALDSYPWTPPEVDRMCKIFQGETWFIAPENSANKPA